MIKHISSMKKLKARSKKRPKPGKPDKQQQQLWTSEKAKALFVQGLDIPGDLFEVAMTKGFFKQTKLSATAAAYAPGETKQATTTTHHNSTSQQSNSCVSVSGFAAVGVRNPTGDRVHFQSEFACASSVAFSLGTQRSPRRGRVRFV